MDNRTWRLESFVDSLAIELDKTREVLAVKSINKPLTYSVKDVALELQIFPTYDGDNIEFRTAQPGQEGASKLSIQFASITDQQVRATTQAPSGRTDVKLDAVADAETQKKLRRLGVTSVEDLERIEKRNVDIQKVGDGAIDYKNLANLIQKARRGQTPPKVTEASTSVTPGGRPRLELKGENLAMSASHVPVALLDGALSEVVEHAPNRVVVELARPLEPWAVNELILTLDPYCVVRMRIAD